MKLIDKTPKKNPAILDNFIIPPEKPTAAQKKALAEIQKLHKHKFSEEA